MYTRCYKNELHCTKKRKQLVYCVFQSTLYFKRGTTDLQRYPNNHGLREYSYFYSWKFIAWKVHWHL